MRSKSRNTGGGEFGCYQHADQRCSEREEGDGLCGVESPFRRRKQYEYGRTDGAGGRIIYSIPGLKVHAKVAVILRKDTEDGCKRRDFAYLSTGNFNEKTARIYSDMALLTSNAELITDINKVFAVLEGKLAGPTFRHLLVARFNMVPELTRMIHREIEHVKAGRKGHRVEDERTA